MVKPRTRSTRFETPSDTEIRIVREVHAPRALVFEAWTTCEHLQRWLLGPEGWEMHVCEIDLRPGGAFRWGWRKEGGQEMEITGVHKEVDPPERLVTTERWGGDWPETLNTLVLTEKDGVTTMTQTVAYPDREARDNALASGMKEGVEQSHTRLEDHLTRAGQ